MFGEYTKTAAPFVTNLTVNGITLQYTGTGMRNDTVLPIYMGGIAGSVKGDNTTKITNCTVKNVNFVASNVTGQQNFGGIVGNTSSGSNTCTISGCTVNKITVNNAVNKKPFVGGIVGYPLGILVLSNCSFTSGTVSFAGMDRFGGFVAWNQKNVTLRDNCTATLNVTFNGGTSGARLGGIIGSINGGTVTYNGCTVSGSMTVSNTSITNKGARYGYKASSATESGTPTTSGLTIN